MGGVGVAGWGRVCKVALQVRQGLVSQQRQLLCCTCRGAGSSNFLRIYGEPAACSALPHGPQCAGNITQITSGCLVAIDPAGMCVRVCMAETAAKLCRDMLLGQAASSRQVEVCTSPVK